jgi:hypothetical protein
MLVFFPFYPALLLAVESNNVIEKRLWKIATGRVHPVEEMRLMVTEKVKAAVEAGEMLGAGRSSGEVIDFYRSQVAANATRLG